MQSLYYTTNIKLRLNIVLYYQKGNSNLYSYSIDLNILFAKTVGFWCFCSWKYENSSGCREW